MLLTAIRMQHINVPALHAQTPTHRHAHEQVLYLRGAIRPRQHTHHDRVRGRWDRRMAVKVLGCGGILNALASARKSSTHAHFTAKSVFLNFGETIAKVSNAGAVAVGAGSSPLCCLTIKRLLLTVCFHFLLIRFTFNLSFSFHFVCRRSRHAGHR